MINWKKGNIEICVDLFSREIYLIRIVDIVDIMTKKNCYNVKQINLLL